VEGERYLVCARHRWRFDLENGGLCAQNGSSIRARCLAPCEAAEGEAAEGGESVA
jgi:UDP-MurNAc hydroxylase